MLSVSKVMRNIKKANIGLLLEKHILKRIVKFAVIVAMTEE